MSKICNLCPRECGADRTAGETGVCGVSGEKIKIARAALHKWEEPCISGDTGSGAVFFCGCPMKCIYCQNQPIAHARAGTEVSVNRLGNIFLELQKQGAANINLVTPTHYTPQIAEAAIQARRDGLQIPLVYNCSGYEKVETLQSLEGIMDIYLTDFKYMDRDLASQYSRAPDYPDIAKLALDEMFRQTGPPEFGETGMLKKGVIVRHLLLPSHVRNAKAVVSYVHEKYGNQVLLSLMNQYTPVRNIRSYPELNRKVTDREYEKLVDYALSLGVEQGYIQEGDTAKESFIPEFDGTGVMENLIL